MTYRLEQVSSNTQSLTPISNPSSTSYSTTCRATAGFMNRKPHVVIKKQEHGIDSDCAEVRYENYGTGTTIFYSSTGVNQDLVLTSSTDQRYECLVSGRPHSWQAVGFDRRALGLVNDAGEKIGWFAYPENFASISDTGSGIGKNTKSGDVGELYIYPGLSEDPSGVEQVVCSALAVVERLRRRTANVCKIGSAYRQGASCGITSSAYGGGVG